MNRMFKIAVVQAYINHMTGRTIQIALPTTVEQSILLEQAYQIANQNLDSITVLTYG